MPVPWSVNRGTPREGRGQEHRGLETDVSGRGGESREAERAERAGADSTEVAPRALAGTKGAGLAPGWGSVMGPRASAGAKAVRSVRGPASVLEPRASAGVWAARSGAGRTSEAAAARRAVAPGASVWARRVAGRCVAHCGGNRPVSDAAVEAGRSAEGGPPRGPRGRAVVAGPSPVGRAFLTRAPPRRAAAPPGCWVRRGAPAAGPRWHRARAPPPHRGAGSATGPAPTVHPPRRSTSPAPRSPCSNPEARAAPSPRTRRRTATPPTRAPRCCRGATASPTPGRRTNARSGTAPSPSSSR
jgi:hypothetical protein